MAKRSKPDVAFVPEGYTYSELRPLVRATLDAELSVMLHGHPGVGKSTLAAEVAADLGLPLIDLRLAQREPAELGGVHVPDRRREQLTLLAPPWVREACEQPALVFLDELNAAVTRLHQAVAYQIVLERRVGPFVFHPGTRVMAAGNLDEDNAIAVPLSSALNNRFAHFTLRVDVAAWLAWAEGAGLPPELLAYFRAHERQGAGLLYANDGADAFPTPRSWEMAGRVYRTASEPLRRRAMSACIGAPAADRFFQYEKLYRRVSPERILAGKQVLDFTTDANSDPSFIHAVLAATAAWVGEQPAFRPEWVQPLLALLKAPGLEAEYQFVFLRDLKRRGNFTDHLRPHPAFRELAGQLVSLHAGLYQ
jgi:hypothetical protein